MAQYLFHHLTIKVLRMRRPVMPLLLILCSLLTGRSLNGSWFSSEKKQSVEPPSNPQTALIDPLAVKRQQAFETLKRHPKLIQYLQENREALGLQGQVPTAITPVAHQNTPVPQQLPQAAKEIINTLRQEQAKSPQRPLFVSVNVNTQSLCNDVNTVNKTTASPPTEPRDDYSPLMIWGSQGLEWARTHKGRCVCYCLLGCCGGIHLYLFFIRRYLRQEESWFRWKNHLTLEELYRLSTTTLAKEIIKSKTNSTYEEGSAPAKTLLKQCLQEIEYELSTLSTYKSFFVYLQAVPLQRLFLWDTTIVKELAYRIQRLSYVKKTILSFLDEPAILQEREGPPIPLPTPVAL